VVFPLSVHGSGRYLVDALGKPFLIVGESAWGVIHRLTLSQVDAYIADRKARGFNTAMIMLMRNQEWVTGGSPPNNANGDPPFSGTPLIPANVVEAYFSHADAILRKFQDAGMLVLLAGCYTGGSNEDGWWDNLTSDSVATNWGRWLGARYNKAAFPNIIWVGGGDRRAPSPSRADALQMGIRDGGGTQIQTYHNDRYHPGFDERSFYPNGQTWLTLNNVYCDDGTTNGSPYTIPEMCAAEYARSGPHPFFLIEDWYLDEHGIDDSESIIEKWQAICSGACGVNTGCASIWPFATGYANDFGRHAHVAMGKLATLCASYEWWTLVPRQNTSLVSSSLGAHGPSRICPAIGNYSGGKFAFVFVPTATSPTVVMTNFTQPTVRARWYDPVSGSFTTVSGSPLPNTGSQTIAHPGQNSIGSRVWILVLD
jgi:hypothetical protein